MLVLWAMCVGNELLVGMVRQAAEPYMIATRQ
jgi:hypothetical protein